MLKEANLTLKIYSFILGLCYTFCAWNLIFLQEAYFNLLNNTQKLLHLNSDINEALYLIPSLLEQRLELSKLLNCASTSKGFFETYIFSYPVLITLLSVTFIGFILILSLPDFMDHCEKYNCLVNFVNKIEGLRQASSLKVVGARSFQKLPKRYLDTFKDKYNNQFEVVTYNNINPGDSCCFSINHALSPIPEELPIDAIMTLVEPETLYGLSDILSIF